MAIITSDDFSGVVNNAAISGRTLNNGLGGSGSRTWSNPGVSLVGSGTTSAYANGSTSAALTVDLSTTDVRKARIKVDPAGATSQIMLVGMRTVLGSGSGSYVMALLAASQASLRVREGTSTTLPNGTDRATLAVTAPGAVFWLELEINTTTKQAVARILNSDLSVRNETSPYTFASLPAGNVWGFGMAGSGTAAVFDDFIVEDGVAADTENPTLTGSITIGTKTTSSIAMSWPAGSDNVAVTSYEVSSSGGSSWTDIGNVLTHTFTGLSAGTSYDLRVRAKDAAGNVSTPALAATESTLASDSTPPTMNGSITVGTKTSGSISISYPAASDNVAVTGYEVRVNGGTWLDNGTSLSYTALGLSALTSCTLDVRAYDGAGNRAVTPLTVTTSTYRAGDTAANIIANTGPVGGNPAGFLYAFASTVSGTDWLSYTITSGPTPSGGTLDAQPDGRFTYTGPAPATMVIQPEVNGVNAAETITVTLYNRMKVIGAKPTKVSARPIARPIAGKPTD